MTVAELIEHLKTLPQNVRVAARDNGDLFEVRACDVTLLENADAFEVRNGRWERTLMAHVVEICV